MPKKKTNAPTIVRPDNIDPQHRWDRPLQAPGHTQVDFEERVNFRRLHDYRLARTRAALAHSGLGALLCFDQHNIRYITSTVIGEWARDKLTRYALLTGNGDPYIWDFGSAAKHHRLHAPWLHHDHCRAGLLGLRGATGADITLFRDAAREIKAILDAEGVGTMPIGLDVVEPPMMFELQKLGIDVRDGQQTLLQAREVKNIDVLKPGVSSDKIARSLPKAEEIGFSSEMEAFGLNFCHGLGLGLHERPLISRLTSLKEPIELKAGMVFAVETYCPATDGISAARIEEEVILTPSGPKIISLYPAEELPIANPY